MQANGRGVIVYSQEARLAPPAQVPDPRCGSEVSAACPLLSPNVSAQPQPPIVGMQAPPASGGLAATVAHSRAPVVDDTPSVSPHRVVTSSTATPGSEGSPATTRWFRPPSGTPRSDAGVSTAAATATAAAPAAAPAVPVSVSELGLKPTSSCHRLDVKPTPPDSTGAATSQQLAAAAPTVSTLRPTSSFRRLDVKPTQDSAGAVATSPKLARAQSRAKLLAVTRALEALKTTPPVTGRPTTKPATSDVVGVDIDFHANETGAAASGGGPQVRISRHAAVPRSQAGGMGRVPMPTPEFRIGPPDTHTSGVDDAGAGAGQTQPHSPARARPAASPQAKPSLQSPVKQAHHPQHASPLAQDIPSFAPSPRLGSVAAVASVVSVARAWKRKAARSRSVAGSTVDS